MNCIFLLLLLGCCGQGNDCGCQNGGRSGCGNGNGMSGCGCGKEPRRRAPERRGGKEPCGCEKEPCGRGLEPRECDRRPEPCDRRPEPCGCEEERPCRKEERCGCMDGERSGGDGPGLIPPPWQEYPQFPRRDNRENCES